MKLDRVAGSLLLVLGILTLGTGAFFLFVRPPMLPEDIRLTGVEPHLLPPAMLDWLQIVFRTWGGFVLGFGLLLVSVAGFLITARPAWLRWGVGGAVLVAFGRFLVSNVVIGSDYLWFVGMLFSIALVTALRLAFGRNFNRRNEFRASCGTGDT
jgi:hypothetical protein